MTEVGRVPRMRREGRGAMWHVWHVSGRDTPHFTTVGKKDLKHTGTTTVRLDGAEV